MLRNEWIDDLDASDHLTVVQVRTIEMGSPVLLGRRNYKCIPERDLHHLGDVRRPNDGVHSGWRAHPRA